MTTTGTIRFGAAVFAAALLLLGAQVQAQTPDGATPGGQSTSPEPAEQAAEAPTDNEAGPFVFGSPPSAQANRLYSVNVRNGEVSACQFERPEGSVVGVTKCFARDGSAGPSDAGTYDLISTRYSGETGIFRVNTETGQMSVCYVRDMPKEGGGVEPSVVCTPAAR